jgi:carbamate kinase
MAKAVFSKKKILCHQQTGLKFKEDISKNIFGAELCMVLKFEDASESRSEISWKLKCDAGEGWRRSVGFIA